MPCSNPITTYTNARNIYHGVSRWKTTFACGMCDSCIKKHRAEWRVRSYYESQRCLRDGGFVLFDTLTYTDDFIPKYSNIFHDLDIPKQLDNHAFSRSDVQKFFKRLRINLKRNGYDSDGKLRYILSSEYGTDENCTHRPHYHLLFFVNFNIAPLALSRFISRSWSNGKTDGVRPYDDCALCPVKNFCRGNCIYMNSNYVLSERVISRDTSANCMKCVNYVTKYISKDMFNWVNLSRRVDDLFDVIMPDFRTDYEKLKFYRRFRSQVLPFHLQSRGFGLFALENEQEREFIEKYNKIRVPSDKKDIIKAIALPRYYERKLYYNFEKIDGRVHWFLSEYGMRVKLKQLDNKINSFIAEYRAFDAKISSEKLYDLALYNCVYRNTISDVKSLMLPYKEYYKICISPHSSSETPMYFNFNTEKDKFYLGKFLSPSFIVNDDGEIIYQKKQIHKEFLPRSGYVVVTEKLCPFWSGFELLLAKFQRYKNNLGIVHDVISAADAAQLDRYKTLGLIKS